MADLNCYIVMLENKNKNATQIKLEKFFKKNPRLQEEKNKELKEKMNKD